MGVIAIIFSQRIHCWLSANWAISTDQSSNCVHVTMAEKKGGWGAVLKDVFTRPRSTADWRRAHHPRVIILLLLLFLFFFLFLPFVNSPVHLPTVCDLLGDPPGDFLFFFFVIVFIMPSSSSSSFFFSCFPSWRHPERTGSSSTGSAVGWRWWWWLAPSSGRFRNYVMITALLEGWLNNKCVIITRNDLKLN